MGTRLDGTQRASDRRRAAFTVIALVVSMLAAVPGWGGQAGAQTAASPPPVAGGVPPRVLPSVMTGKAAVAAVGVDAVAAWNRSLPRAAVERALADPNGRVDPTGRIFFADDGLGEDHDHAGAHGDEVATVEPMATAEPAATAAPVTAAATDGGGPSVGGGTPAIAPADAFNLASRPGSTKVIYLDFNGETVTGSAWNANSGNPSIVASPFDRDGDPSRLPSPLPPPLVKAASVQLRGRWPWEARIPLDTLAAASFPKLVVSGGHSALFDGVCDMLESALGARRVVLAGAGHTIPALGDPVNEVLAAFWDAVG